MGLKIDNLTGGYTGNQVLHNVSFEVADGQIVALIGLNGAGKSTTINHIIGELLPKSGKITLNGLDLAQDPSNFKAQLAYIPEQPILYEELTLGEHLDLMLAAHGLDKATVWPDVVALLTLFRLADKLHWLPSHFSKGMRQKVMLVSAFMLKAPLLLVDEPFLGLDTLAHRDVVRLMQAQASAGNSVLMTTHLLSSAAQFVDTFVVLEAGQVRFVGTPQALADQYQLTLATLDDYFDLAQGAVSHGHD